MNIKLDWGTGLALVYTTFALATAGFVAFAMGRPVDLVSKDYYAQSLRQDQRMEAERNALALDPAPNVVQPDGRTVVLSLPRDHASAARGTVTLYRASDAKADRVVPLTLDAQGRQQISMEGLLAGQWILQVDWSAARRNYYFEQPVFAR